MGLTQKEFVDSARLVQVERLTDQVGKRTLTQEAMGFVETFYVGRQQGMAHTEGGRCERCQDAGVDVFIVAVPVTLGKFFLLLSYNT